MNYDRSNEPCPKCGGETHQDSVDVGVGVIYGPLGCTECGWSEDSEYDLSGGKSPVREDGSVFDQFGGVWPAESHVAKAYRMAEAAPDMGGEGGEWACQGGTRMHCHVFCTCDGSKAEEIDPRL